MATQPILMAMKEVRELSAEQFLDLSDIVSEAIMEDKAIREQIEKITMENIARVVS